MSLEVWGDSDDDGMDGFREQHEKQLLEDGWLDDATAGKLVKVLRQIEAHHVRLNQRIGRDEKNSETLRLVREALTLAGEAT